MFYPADLVGNWWWMLSYPVFVVTMTSKLLKFSNGRRFTCKLHSDDQVSEST